MKKNILILIISILSIAAFGQSPEFYLGAAPGLPGDICSMKPSEKMKLIEVLQKYYDGVTASVKNIQSAADKDVAKNNDEMKAGTLRNLGYSEEDVQKMKNSKKMSQADKMAIAERYMEQNKNMTMEEARKLKGEKGNRDSEKSVTARKAWAEGYSTEMIADAQADPKKSQQEQNKNKTLIELTQKQQSLSEKLKGAESRHIDQLTKLEKDANDAMVLIFDVQQRLDTALRKGYGKEADALQVQIKKMQDVHCFKFTGRYLSILSEYRSLIPSLLPDYRSLQKIQFELIQAQTGVTKELTNPDQMALEEVQGYCRLQTEVFKYRLYDE